MYALFWTVYFLGATSAGVTGGSQSGVITGFSNFASCQYAQAQIVQTKSAPGNTDGNLRSQAYCFPFPTT